MLPCSFGSITVRSAHLGDLPVIGRLMAPFVAQGELLAADRGRNVEPPAAVVPGRGGGPGRGIRCLGDLLPEAFRDPVSFVRGIGARSGDHRGPAACMPGAGPRAPHPRGDGGGAAPLGIDAYRVRLPCHPAGPKKGDVHPHGPRLERQECVNSTGSRCRDVVIRPACIGDATSVARFLAPFVARGELLPRTEEELLTLLRHGFVAEAKGRIVGFTALEIYSEKLAEVQCVSVEEAYRGQGIGRRLIMLCVDRARQLHIAETMAITAREEVLRHCGFDDSLPGTRSPCSCAIDSSFLSKY